MIFQKKDWYVKGEYQVFLGAIVWQMIDELFDKLRLAILLSALLAFVNMMLPITPTSLAVDRALKWYRTNILHSPLYHGLVLMLIVAFLIYQLLHRLSNLRMIEQGVGKSYDARRDGYRMPYLRDWYYDGNGWLVHRDYIKRIRGIEPHQLTLKKTPKPLAYFTRIGAQLDLVSKAYVDGNELGARLTGKANQYYIVHIRTCTGKNERHPLSVEKMQEFDQWFHRRADA